MNKAIDYKEMSEGTKKVNAQLIDTDLGKSHVTTAQFIASCQAGRIIGYSNNRGTGKASRKTVSEIVNNFDPDCIGEIALARIDSNLLEVVEGHGRLGGIIERYKNYGLNTYELSSKIAINVLPPDKKFKAYQKYNFHSGHTVGNMMINPDLLFKDMVDEVLEHVDLDSTTKELIDSSKNYPILADVLVSQHLKNSKGYVVSSFVDVYKVRRMATKMADTTREETNLKITETDKKSLAEGMEYYCRYLNRVRELDIERKTKNYNLLNKAGWMGALITDITFNKGDRVFYKNPERMAENCVQNVASLAPLLNNVCGSNAGYMINTLKEIDRILRGRVK